MHFVNNVDLVSSLGRGEVNFLPQITHVVYTTLAGGVYLHHIQCPAIVDRLADMTLVARLSFRRVEAIDSLGKNAGSTGLTRAPRPAEEVGMGYPSLDYSLL